MGFLKATEVRSTTFFGGEISPAVPYRIIVWHFKEPHEYERDTSLARFISFVMFPLICYKMTLLVGLPENSGGRIKSFPCRYHSTVVLNAHYHLGDEQ
jgi:hypothetical protein